MRLIKALQQNYFLLTVPRRCFFCGSYLLFMFCVCHAFLSVGCGLVVTCWKRANLLALLCVMFYCVFVTFQCGVLGQVWYLNVSISDLCILSYFHLIFVSNAGVALCRCNCQVDSCKIGSGFGHPQNSN